MAAAKSSLSATFATTFLIGARNRTISGIAASVMNIIKPGPQFTRVAQNELGEATYASPAISDGQLFLRGAKHLFCIGPDSR